MFMRKFLSFFIFSIDAMKLYTLYYKYFKYDICIGYAGFIMECGYLVDRLGLACLFVCLFQGLGVDVSLVRLASNLPIRKFEANNSTRRTLLFIQCCLTCSNSTVITFVSVKVDSYSKGEMATCNEKRIVKYLKALVLLVSLFDSKAASMYFWSVSDFFCSPSNRETDRKKFRD